MLKKICFYFRENIKSEPGCVMTCIFRKMLPDHQSRIKTKTNSILCLDSNKKLVFLEKSSKKNINLPTVRLFFIFKTILLYGL